MADVVASDLLHEAINSRCLWRCGRQVDVIVHEHVGVQFAASVEQRLAQQRQVTSSIDLIEKAGEAVIAALDNMLRNAGQVESRSSAVA